MDRKHFKYTGIVLFRPIHRKNTRKNTLTFIKLYDVPFPLYWSPFCSVVLKQYFWELNLSFLLVFSSIFLDQRESYHRLSSVYKYKRGVNIMVLVIWNVLKFSFCLVTSQLILRSFQYFYYYSQNDYSSHLRHRMVCVYPLKWTPL